MSERAGALFTQHPPSAATWNCLALPTLLHRDLKKQKPVPRGEHECLTQHEGSDANVSCYSEGTDWNGSP